MFEKKLKIYFWDGGGGGRRSSGARLLRLNGKSGPASYHYFLDDMREGALEIERLPAVSFFVWTLYFLNKKKKT